MKMKEWEAAFEAYVQRLMDDFQVPGAIIAVAKDGELTYEKAFGFRDREKQAPIDLDTVFGIGSITKSFTCMAIMQLQEEGKLSVHDPVITYLPEFRTPDEAQTKSITIHHFMTHTLGFPPLPSLIPAMLPSLQADPTADELLHHFEDQCKHPIDTFEDLMTYIEKLPFELLGPAGTEFSYSNEGFGLLGAIIERASGKPYEAYVQEHILQPIGMERTVFHVEELAEDNNTTMLYTRRMKDGVREVVRAPGWWDAPSMRAAGFLKSTARDMLRYADVYRTGGLSNRARIISGDSASQMIAPHVRVDLSRSYGYGLGMFPFSEDYTLLTHTGGLKGMTAQMFIVPEAGVTGILLTNMDDAPISNLSLGLLNSMFGRLLETQFATFPEYEVPLAYLQQCPGTYKSGEGDVVEIRFDEAQSQLMLVLGSDVFPLRPVGENTFLFTRHNIDSLIRFVRHPEGEIKRLAFGSRQMPKAI
ncbi:serine hydrolase domain-containing protein [Brevibacillus brevis]|uniref:serine hydrolase domain-containing protein n=1 Tax=Brevibacillus brevis TaxID=1393 RepID=UPI0025A54BDD|nr:serine hydrolase domain-containing protein [Brevibacillus brevis]WJQ84364.1 serine hydrolase domain-containing protein [Brevibacillus brevis]